MRTDFRGYSGGLLTFSERLEGDRLARFETPAADLIEMNEKEKLMKVSVIALNAMMAASAVVSTAYAAETAKEVDSSATVAQETQVSWTDVDNLHVGGSNKNPVKETVALYDGGDYVEEHFMGRGRRGIVTIAQSGNDLVVTHRLENRHRSRGWTLRVEVRFYDELGNLIGETFHQRGLGPKGWGSYKRSTVHKTVKGIAANVAYVQTTMYRNSTQRFLGELAENVAKYGPDIVKAASGDPMAIAKLAVKAANED